MKRLTNAEAELKKKKTNKKNKKKTFIKNKHV